MKRDRSSTSMPRGCSGLDHGWRSHLSIASLKKDQARSGTRSGSAFHTRAVMRPMYRDAARETERIRAEPSDALPVEEPFAVALGCGGRAPVVATPDTTPTAGASR